MTELGINVNYMNADDLLAYAKDTEKVSEELKPVLGWN